MHSNLKGISNTRGRGFSLVEVVVAVGIFAIAIVSVIGLLVPINSSVADIKDTEDASRLATSVQAQLQRLSFASVKAILDTPPANDNDQIFASRDGNIVETGRPDLQLPARTNIWDVQNVRSQVEEDALKFFQVDLVRNVTLSPVGNDGATGYLAFTIKLTWPAFAANGDKVNPAQQNSLLVSAAITR